MIHNETYALQAPKKSNTQCDKRRSSRCWRRGRSARKRLSPKFHLKSARRSRWLMDRSKTRTVLLKKLTRNGASCGFPLPSLVALRPSNWNIGRWNEAKSEVMSSTVETFRGETLKVTSRFF